jgi:small conductance mechanosensitive channel
MEQYWDTIQSYLTTYGLKVVAAIIIFIIGKWLAGVISRVVEKLLVKSEVDNTLATFAKRLVYILLLVFVIIAALNKLGVQTTSLVAILGAAGLAVAFALQGSLSNFASGVMLIMFKPFKVGDFVEVAGTLGAVQGIHIFNTILSSPDNRRIIIPNSQITSDKITNFTAIDRRRIDLVFGVSYDDDLKKAKDILQAIVTSDERVLKDPAPTIGVSELADSSVNIVCRPWVKPEDYWDVYFDTVEKAKVQLESSGLSIPYPQTDVHMFEEKKAAQG